METEKITEVAPPPVRLTENALKEIKKLQESEGLSADHGLRVGVKGGGCSGMTYVLGFDAKQEDDEEFLMNGIHVLVNKSHQLYLYGMEVDYQSGLNARGFVFNNPNAKTTCGCGTSFSA